MNLSALWMYINWKNDKKKPMNFQKLIILILISLKIVLPKFGVSLK